MFLEGGSLEQDLGGEVGFKQLEGGNGGQGTWRPGD